MTALVAAETVLIALLLILVAGLLRSHAEILRRLHGLEEGDGGSGEIADDGLPSEALMPARAGEDVAPSIDGRTLTGDAVRVGFAPGADTLVAFLTSGCSVCRELWAELDTTARGPLEDVRIVVVPKDRRLESMSKLRKLAPADATVVLSSAAWEDFGVPASPYFVHVGRDGTIVGEGVSSSWNGVASLLADARSDLAEQMGGETADSPGRMRRAEDELERAGVGPEDPTLYGHAARDAA